jgi:hypothetical protein
MAQAIERAIQLVSGAFGATSFDQLLPGTLVKDEFGRIYGFVVAAFVSAHPDFRASDAAALSVVINVDHEHPDFDRIGGQVAISGRFLEPVQHGPRNLMPGYYLLRRLVLEPGEARYSERVRP